MWGTLSLAASRPPSLTPSDHPGRAGVGRARTLRNRGSDARARPAFRGEGAPYPHRSPESMSIPYGRSWDPRRWTYPYGVAAGEGSGVVDRRTVVVVASMVWAAIGLAVALAA